MINKTRIGVDARFYGPVGKGLGRYTKEVLDRMIALMPEAEFVVFLSAGNFADFQATDSRVTKVLLKTRWYTLAEQLVLPWLIWKYKITIFHSPHFNVPVFAPCKLVVTIHDLILINYPTTRATRLGPVMYFVKQLGYKLVIWSAIKRAKLIFAVSEFTKQDILRNFKIEAEKIIVTLEGVTSLEVANDSSDSVDLQKLGIKQPYLLYVGNAYPHKNLEGLVQMFAKLIVNHPEYFLVLVGRDDYFYTRVRDLVTQIGLADKVLFPNYLSDRELVEVYKQATLYIFPSFYEGFGLPPLEAMSHGLPVASSNQGSMPEILGEAAMYFDPGDQDSMLNTISGALVDENLRNQYRLRGYEQIKRYSWDDCAQITVENLMRCL